jgi:L-lactate dehydrogenase complex protein LldF
LSARSELAKFKALAAVKSADEKHARTLLKAITTHERAMEAMKPRQFHDWQEARALAARIKDHGLENLPELLERFERKMAGRGATVLWAETAQEARDYLRDIVRRHDVKLAVKAKSMTTEEVGVNELLEELGVELLETDLGEFIVQLAGQKAYHILTPAMHKSKEDINALFHEKLGAPEIATPEELTAIARRHLRDIYTKAGMGISGANFLLADEGAVVVTENEGNARLCMACPPVHVVFAGIEKILPSFRDLRLFLPLLATSGTGQQVTCYNSIVRGPRAPGESDGPEEMVVILLDNGRTRLFERETFREALRCIRCGACLNACPVYRAVGGYTYNTTYQGPIGSVITPHLRELDRWKHLSFASSLCGACAAVCPVHIDIHHLLLENRWRATRQARGGLLWKIGMKSWALVTRSRRRLDLARWAFRWVEPLARALAPKSLRSHVPHLSRKSFAKLWKERKDVQS